MTDARLLDSIRAATDVMRRAAIDLCLEVAMDRFERALRAGPLERRYNPDWRSQPRVPRGDPEGGQWISGSGGGSGEADAQVPSDPARPGRGGSARTTAPAGGPAATGPVGVTDPRVISDASPEDDWTPGEQYAQARPPTPPTPRGTGGSRRIADRVFINGRQVYLPQGQATQLDLLSMQRDVAIARVREIEPNWRPRERAFENVEGLIAATRGELAEAQARFTELHRVGVVGPAQNPSGSIPARGPSRRLTEAEREIINRLGEELGCHTCGRFNPGTPLGNWVADHQMPNALNPPGAAQRLYPQCLSCSRRQGGWIKNHRGDWE